MNLFRILTIFVFLFLILPMVVLGQSSIFASREGLDPSIPNCPCTTTSGHVINYDDWFVALPSGTLFPGSLYGLDSWQYRVRINYPSSSGQNRSVIAPVWDKGPWNINDDYWNSDSIRGIYSAMATFWSNPNAAPQGPPPGWNQPSPFPTPILSEIGTSQASVAFGPLGVGNPEATQAQTTSGPPPEGTITANTYNYGGDQFGRTVFENNLNGAGIDLGDGVYLLGLGLTGNANISWDLTFTSAFPSISNISLINQQGVTLYNRVGGKTMPVTDVPLTQGQTVTVAIQFNQSMFETQMDDDQNFINATGGVTVGTAMPFVYYGNSPVTITGINGNNGNGWATVGSVYGDDTWTGITTIPTSISGPQTLTVQSYLTAFTANENGNEVPNQLDEYCAVNKSFSGFAQLQEPSPRVLTSNP